MRLRVESEDFVVQPDTNIMFDCHGTKSAYRWDGGKTWVVKDKVMLAVGVRSGVRGVCHGGIERCIDYRLVFYPEGPRRTHE